MLVSTWNYHSLLHFIVILPKALNSAKQFKELEVISKEHYMFRHNLMNNHNFDANLKI